MEDLIYFFILIGVISLLPNFKLLKNYKQTKITEFLLFAIMFILASIFFISVVLASRLNSLLYWKLAAILLNSTFYCILQHAFRLMWHKPPKYLTTFFTIWWLTTIAIILIFWDFMPIEESAQVIFMQMGPNQPVIRSLDYDIGYKLSNGTVIYSYQYNLISLFLMFSAGVFNIVGYFTVKGINVDKSSRTAQILMQIATISLMLAIILSVIPQEGGSIGSTILLLVTFGLIDYVAYRHPTILLITHAQIIRAMEIYKDIDDITDLNNPRYKDEILIYLNRIKSILE